MLSVAFQGVNGPTGGKAAHIEPMSAKRNDPSTMEAMGSPEKLGELIGKEPKAKAILVKHGYADGATFAHGLLTVVAVQSVAVKVRDWGGYQKQARMMRRQVATSTAMMKNSMQAALQNLQGEEKAKKQKEVDQLKAAEAMMVLLADYAEKSPKGNYKLVVKYRDELGPTQQEKRKGK